MKTRQDFVAVIDRTADKYDQIAALRRAGDPRYFQQQEAMATMFAMLSQQIEIGMMEPFDKVRDATVLADAALKGIIPKASPARVRLKVTNINKAAAFTIAAGRRLTDANGHIYEVDRPVVVPPAKSDTEPGVATVEAIQRTVRKIVHTVTENKGFYTIEVPPAEDGRKLASIAVENASGVPFRFTPGFVNVWPGDRIYHVESDAYRRLFVKFGLVDVVGYQPIVGEKLTLIITESVGDVRPAIGSPFSLEYAYTPADGLVAIEFAELMIAGYDPIGMAELRELCRYPSTYDDSAVYLGEFDFLVRRQFPNLPFLSIWNEQIEEQARGANMDNINRLFLSMQVPAGADKAATFSVVKKIILGADDSFDIKEVAPVELPIAVSVTAQISRIHDVEGVKAQIIQAVLAEYGRDSAMAKRGMVQVQFKRIYDYLRLSIPALQDAGSDFSVAIAPPTVALMPEHWRYVSTASLTVTIQAVDYNLGSWGR